MFNWLKSDVPNGTQDDACDKTPDFAHSWDDAPIGVDEFTKWTEQVIALTRLPLNDSMRFAVASIVLDSKDILSAGQCAEKLVKAAQNQIAAYIFQTIKSNRIAADAAELAAKTAATEAQEATPPTNVVEGAPCEPEKAESNLVSET